MDNKYAGHSFNGYICDDTPYLFDSNNIIFNDNWVHGDFTNYIQYYKYIFLTAGHDGEPDPVYNKVVIYIDFLVYVYI